MKQQSNAPEIKLGLIGPIAPYRGGIPQYNTQLNRSLKAVDHLTISFKRMYPAFLYPGSQMHERGADKEAGVEYLIDAYNPLSWRRTADRLIAAQCNVVIVTWWTLFWQPAFVLITRRLKKHGVKVLFLCHNVGDHDANVLTGWLSKHLIRAADGYVVQSVGEQMRLQAQLNRRTPITIINHPINTGFSKATKRLPKRGRLELLFFGFIRPYKGVELLVEALKQLDDTEVYLSIVGEVWGDKSELQKLANAQNIDCHLQYVDDREAAAYFERADVVVLPYKSATGSAVATLAYHYGKPILATAVDGLTDVVKDGKTGWLVPPNSSEALAKSISLITRREAANMHKAIAKYCKAHSWQASSKQLINFCTSLVTPS